MCVWIVTDIFVSEKQVLIVIYGLLVIKSYPYQVSDKFFILWFCLICTTSPSPLHKNKIIHCFSFPRKRDKNNDMLISGCTNVKKISFALNMYSHENKRLRKSPGNRSSWPWKSNCIYLKARGKGWNCEGRILGAFSLDLGFYSL